MGCENILFNCFFVYIYKVRICWLVAFKQYFVRSINSQLVNEWVTKKVTVKWNLENEEK